MSKALVIRGADFSENALDIITFDVIHCESITLDHDELELDTINATQQLTATVLPADCEEETNWTSSDEDCCTVSSTGLVTVVGCGSCTITARCGQHTATCSITVEVELGNYGRYRKSQVYYANESNLSNDLCLIDSLLNHDYYSMDNLMLMCSLDSTQQRLAIDAQIIKKNSETQEWYIPNPLPAASSNDTSSRRIGFCVSIMLPPNCKKVKCISPADLYASRAIFFGSETPASTESPKYVLFSHAYHVDDGGANYNWDYSVREKEFDVPAGADSVAISWKADTANGATSFKDMTDALLAQFVAIGE